MRRKFSICAVILCILLIMPCSVHAFDKENGIASIFAKYNLTGTFIMYDISNKKYLMYNSARAFKRFSPGSTFKIPHSLIALETGYVHGVNEVFYHYSNEPVFLESWKSDASLQSAIKISQVPAYKYMASKIGKNRMQEHLNKLDYGNKQIGTENAFWLDNSLQISAYEQIEFLKKLVLLQLPYSECNQQAVQRICLRSMDSDCSWYGKTGWATDNVRIPIGWFIGWLHQEKSGKTYLFALNADIASADDLYKREACVKDIFEALHITDKGVR